MRRGYLLYSAFASYEQAMLNMDGISVLAKQTGWVATVAVRLTEGFRTSIARLLGGTQSVQRPSARGAKRWKIYCRDMEGCLARSNYE